MASPPLSSDTLYTGQPRIRPVCDLAPCALVDSLTKTYPQLALALDLLRLTVHLLMTPEQPDPIDPTAATPLPLSLMEDILQCRPGSKKRVTGRALEDLQLALEAVAHPSHTGTVFVVPASYVNRSATQVRISLPPWIEALAREARDVPEDGQITLDGWCRVTVDSVKPALRRGEPRKRLNAMRKDVLESQAGATGLSVRLQEHLIMHDLKVYDRLCGRIREKTTGPFVREHFASRDEPRYAVVAALRGILGQPVPVYRTSPNTARITPVGWSLGSLPSKVRRHLSEALGWVELDLAHAQLACNAAAWNVQPVLKTLRDPEYRFWDDLLAHLGLDKAHTSPDDYADVKRLVKRPVHGLSFGMGRDRILALGFAADEAVERAAAEELLMATCGKTVAEAGQKLITHHLLGAMLRARWLEFKRVREQGGRTDALGVFHEFKPDSDPEESVGEAQVLARVTQAQELHLLEPVIDDAIKESTKRRPLYRIVLWQHDGFSVHVKDKAQKDAIARRLQELVAARAGELGIPTRLERDH